MNDWWEIFLFRHFVWCAENADSLQCLLCFLVSICDPLEILVGIVSRKCRELALLFAHVFSSLHLSLKHLLA